MAAATESVMSGDLTALLEPPGVGVGVSDITAFERPGVRSVSRRAAASVVAFVARATERALLLLPGVAGRRAADRDAPTVSACLVLVSLSKPVATEAGWSNVPAVTPRAGVVPSCGWFLALERMTSERWYNPVWKMNF